LVPEQGACLFELLGAIDIKERIDEPPPDLDRGEEDLDGAVLFSESPDLMHALLETVLEIAGQTDRPKSNDRVDPFRRCRHEE
jgi:hypothetical protein